MFSLHFSSHFQKIGISSLIFLSGMGSAFAAPLTPSGETDGGWFSLYFKNIVGTSDCIGMNVLTGFDSTAGATYLTKKCISIGPTIGAFFAGQPTAPVGTAITGFNLDGSPKFGQASQWVGSVPGNIYYTGGNVGIGTNIIGNKDKLRIETPETFWGTVFYRNGGIIGGIHTNSAMLTLQNMSGAQIYMTGTNIGIGTTNPLTKLQVAGEVSSTSANAFRMIQGNYGAFWRNDATNVYLLSTNSGNQYGIWNTSRPFVYNFASGTVALANGAITALSAGNVGIGTSTPLTKLQVAGEVSSVNTNSFRIVQGNYGAFWRNNGSDLYLLSTNSTDQYGTYNTYRPFRYNFGSGGVFIGNNTLTVLNTGNVGIGSTSPGAKLAIDNAGANQTTLSIGDNGLDNGGTYGMVNLTRPADTTRASLAFIRKGNYVWQMGYVPNTNNFGIYPWNLNSNGVPAMTFGSNGNVGIGIGSGTVSTPNHKLVVAGTDAVAHFMSNGGNAYLRLSIYNDISRRIELANRDGRTALWNPQTGDAFNILHTNGNVGIGMTNPASKLDVKGEVISRYLNDGAGIYSQFRAIQGNYGFMIRNDGSNTYFLLTNSGDPQGTWNTLRPFIINNTNGNVAINTRLTVNGSMYATNYYYTSDKRLKKDIVPIISPLEKIKALGGYTFSWKDTGAKSVGLIAQEVEKVFPELVGETQTASGMTIKTVQYGNLVAPLIESVKELSRLHEEDQKKIEDLKSEVEQMKKDIEFLRSQIKK